MISSPIEWQQKSLLAVTPVKWVLQQAYVLHYLQLKTDKKMIELQHEKAMKQWVHTTQRRGCKQRYARQQSCD